MEDQPIPFTSTINLVYSSPLHSRNNNFSSCYVRLLVAKGATSQDFESFNRDLETRGGGGDSNIKKVGVLVVSLRGVNFRFWSRLGC